MRKPQCAIQRSFCRFLLCSACLLPASSHATQRMTRNTCSATASPTPAISPPAGSSSRFAGQPIANFPDPPSYHDSFTNGPCCGAGTCRPGGLKTPITSAFLGYRLPGYPRSRSAPVSCPARTTRSARSDRRRQHSHGQHPGCQPAPTGRGVYWPLRRQRWTRTRALHRPLIEAATTSATQRFSAPASRPSERGLTAEIAAVNDPARRRCAPSTGRQCAECRCRFLSSAQDTPTGCCTAA